MNKSFKLLFASLVSASFILVGCSSGNSSSGADQVENSMAGDMLPAAFVGTYIGTLNVTAEASGITDSDSFPITITVTADGQLRFDGDEPDETFTVGVENDGTFAGNLRYDDDEISGVLGVSGRVDGTTASGEVSGEAEFDTGIVTLDVDIFGDFSATKQ